MRKRWLLYVGMFCLSIIVVSVWSSAARADVAVYDDLWDVSQGTTVTDNSPPYAYFGESAADIFGASGGIEGGTFLWSDSYPQGTVHWVEWQTAEPVEVRRFNLVAGHETVDRRSFDHFSLFAESSGAWATLYDSDISLPYGGGPNYTETHWLELNEPVNTVVSAEAFRAEFRQYSTDPTARGPRIVELDGLVPEPATLALLAVGGLAALARRRGRR